MDAVRKIAGMGSGIDMFEIIKECNFPHYEDIYIFVWSIFFILLTASMAISHNYLLCYVIFL